MSQLKKSTFKSSLGFKALVLLCIAVLVIVVLDLTNTTHIFHGAKPAVSTIPSTHPHGTIVASSKNGQALPKNSPSSVNDQNSKDIAPVSPTDSNSTMPPLKPAGNWISDHKPSLGAQPYRAQENSVCVTTPGASCYLEFTQGNVVKKLDAETTDSNGAAYWTWSVSDNDFTTGTWQVAIIATLNGKSTTSADVIEVQP